MAFPLDSDVNAGDTGHLQAHEDIAAALNMAFGSTMPAAAVSTLYQPLDSDLTAIAALTTTTYGRSLLTLANQAALDALLSGAYAGLLTSVRYNPATSSAFSTTSSTFADVSTSNLAVTFTPTSTGKVLVVLEGYGRPDSTSTTLAWNLRDGSGDVAGTNRLIYQATQRARLRTSIYLSGLTPGQSYTYKWGFASTDNTNAVRIQQGVSGGEGPSIMEVWSVQ